MSITDDVIAHDVRAYAAQVRAALADLGPEQVDDLTDGLEANLADALADAGRAHGGSLVEEFGAPDAYAAELRAAAGLAPGGPAPRPEGRVRATLLRPWREARDGALVLLARLRETRWFPGVEELVVELRPAWWVLRGWALAHLVLQVLGAEPHAFWVPSTTGGWLVLLLAVVASAQWGRGRWRTGPRWHRVLRVANGVLAFAAFLLVVTLPQSHRNDVLVETWQEPDPVAGVWVADERVTNLFVYDAEGRPVEGAQVFDQDGRPVVTEQLGDEPWMQEEHWPDDASGPLLHVGVPGVNGETRWNVYPLHSVPARIWEDRDERLDVTEPRVGRRVTAPAWPFGAAAPVTPWSTSTGATPAPTPTAPADDATQAPDGSAPAAVDPSTEAPAADAAAGAPAVAAP